MLRKQLTYLTIFKTKNMQDWHCICSEVLNMSKADSMVLYDYVFDAPYTHLDVDTCRSVLYRNFNRLELENKV